MIDLKLDYSKYEARVSKTSLYKIKGKITKSTGLIFEGYLPGAALGSIIEILPENQDHLIQKYKQEKFTNKNDSILAEVIGFREKRVILMPFEEARGVSTNSMIQVVEQDAAIPVGDFLLGRVLDGKGDPIDGKGPLDSSEQVMQRSIYQKPLSPLERSSITEPLDLGVRAINGFITCGKGQRMGIMAGSGVGKSVLLGMMARGTKADVNVIALIGERGREVREFIERDLGEEGLKRSVVVVSTSDKSPLLRMRGAFVATTIAEHFALQGLNVLLMMDSVTRFAMAQREIGLSVGEPPATKGYTPSVFSILPKLLERAGMAKNGSITALYTVLVEGDDFDEPIADATRSILDGHIVLSRQLASRNHFPAIDVLSSVSRVMRSVIEPQHAHLAATFRELLSVYAANEDLLNIGAYTKGANPKLDQAIAIQEKLKNYLRQSIEEKTTVEEGILQLQSILRAI